MAQMEPIMLMKRDVMGDYDKAKIWAIIFVLGDALFWRPIYTHHLKRRGDRAAALHSAIESVLPAALIHRHRSGAESPRL